MKEKSILNLIVEIIILLLIIVFYYILISSENQLLEISAILLSLFFLLGNIYYIIKNQSIMKKSKRMVKKKNISEIHKNPLEVYLISSIWNHKKITVGDGQISSSLLYEISEETISFNNDTLSISSKLDLDTLGIAERFLFETVFLDSISNQQGEETKLEKLKKMQKEKTIFPLVVVAENIKNNICNKDATHALIIKVRDQYFETVENDFTAILTILSIGISLLNLLEAITFMKIATVYNFYAPVILAFLLVATITSKYRERVLLKENRIEEITNTLNYIHSLAKKEITANDKVYLCSLGLLSKAEREQMVSLFQVE